MKKRLILPLLFLAVFAFVLAGCKKTETTDTTASTTETAATDTTASSPATDTSATAASTTTTGTTSPANLSEDDKKFMEKAAQGGLAEVALGQDVSSRGTNPDVKAFAQRMVTDHGAANQELQQLASSKGVTLPTDLGEHKSMQEKLAKLNGAKLDKEYISGMVKDHENDVKEFEKESKSGQDPDVKAWAAKTLPTLQDHLKQAKTTNDKVK